MLTDTTQITLKKCFIKIIHFYNMGLSSQTVYQIHSCLRAVISAVLIEITVLFFSARMLPVNFL